jgi:hypothetical protein
MRFSCRFFNISETGSGNATQVCYAPLPKSLVGRPKTPVYHRYQKHSDGVNLAERC